MLEHPVSRQFFDFTTISFVNGNWATIVIMVVFLLFMLNIVLYRRKYVLALQAVYSQRLYLQLIKEGKIFNEGSFVFSLPTILLVIGLAFVQLSTHFWTQFQTETFFIQHLAIAALVFGVLYLLKLLINYVLFELFEVPEDRYAFNLVDYSFLLSVCILLFLCVVITQYTGFYQSYYVFAALLCLLILLKNYRLFSLKSRKIHLFYFFMYFCTLEILPYLVLLKLLLSLDK